MGTGNANADEAVLNMLQRYEMLMMEASSDGQISVGHNCFSPSTG